MWPEYGTNAFVFVGILLTFIQPITITLTAMVSTPKDITTTCPHCGRYTYQVHMNANTTIGFTLGNCSYCHHQGTVEYQNDSFDTRIRKIR